MDEDNWKHKSKDMTCESCMYFINFRCRKHAPTFTGWPAVYPNDWCGDHKLNKSLMSDLFQCRLKSEVKLQC